MYYVYLLQSKKNGTLYTGCTSDLVKRMGEHNNGRVFSTKGKRPFVLMYYEAYLNKSDAFHREHNLKLRANALTGLKRRLKNSLSKAL
ncbi:MAG: GIY-YIG nuclease family protein [Candidatus Azambacteria bacterium]|nr:GIY-YIG nuclease family protein [Candidatus Azambacteria bacterium]